MKHDSNTPGTGVAPAPMQGASILGRPSLVATWRRACVGGRPFVRIFDASGVDEGVFTPASSIVIIGEEGLEDLLSVICRAMIDKDIVSVDAPALLDDDMKALDYYRACLEEREPKWVPCRVRLKSLVTGDFPIGYATVVEAGEHDCQSNKNGAISVLATNGKMLGVKPSEFEPIAWRENSPAGGAA